MNNFAIKNLNFFFYQTGLATARCGEISERNQGAGRLCPLQGPQVRDLRGLRQLHVCRIPRHSRTSKSGSFIRIQHQSVPFLQLFKFDCFNVTFLWWPKSAAAATMQQQQYLELEKNWQIWGNCGKASWNGKLGKLLRQHSSNPSLPSCKFCVSIEKGSISSSLLDCVWKMHFHWFWVMRLF